MNLFELSHYYGNKPDLSESYSSWINPSNQASRIKEFYYPCAAFATARKLIEQITEAERLVPLTTINLFKSESKYAHITVSLESMESAFSSKDAANLLAASLALVQEILNLHPNVEKKSKGGIKKQLNTLLSQEGLLDEFGVSREIIEILDMCRFIRNTSSQHKKAGSVIVPMSGAFGVAMLAISLLNGTLSAGHLIHISNKNN